MRLSVKESRTRGVPGGASPGIRGLGSASMPSFNRTLHPWAAHPFTKAIFASAALRTAIGRLFLNESRPIAF